MKFLNLLAGCLCAVACVKNIMETDAVLATMFGIGSFLNFAQFVRD